LERSGRCLFENCFRRRKFPRRGERSHYKRHRPVSFQVCESEEREVMKRKRGREKKKRRGKWGVGPFSIVNISPELVLGETRGNHRIGSTSTSNSQRENGRRISKNPQEF